jgi:hypothetical protein
MSAWKPIQIGTCIDCGGRCRGHTGRCRRCRAVHRRAVYGLPPAASASDLQRARRAWRDEVHRTPCPTCAGSGHPHGGPECPDCGA